MRNVDVEFASTPTQIDAYLERYRPWLESNAGLSADQRAQGRDGFALRRSDVA